MFPFQYTVKLNRLLRLGRSISIINKSQYSVSILFINGPHRSNPLLLKSTPGHRQTHDRMLTSYQICMYTSRMNRPHIVHLYLMVHLSLMCQVQVATSDISTASTTPSNNQAVVATTVDTANIQLFHNFNILVTQMNGKMCACLVTKYLKNITDLRFRNHFFFEKSFTKLPILQFVLFISQTDLEVIWCHSQPKTHQTSDTSNPRHIKPKTH